jgi:hypothetical protein
MNGCSFFITPEKSVRPLMLTPKHDTNRKRDPNRPKLLGEELNEVRKSLNFNELVDSPCVLPTSGLETFDGSLTRNGSQSFSLMKLR